jgi:hypothetical protein
MNTFLLVYLIIIGNAFLGAIVFASLDTKDEIFFKWYEKCPSQILQFFVLELWFVMAFFMIRYRLCSRKEEEHF